MSPFPGIDPYIEAQSGWADFHARFLIYCCDMLNVGLPDLYVARTEEQVRLVRKPPEPSSGFRPDVAILREPGVAAQVRSVRSGTATLEPVSVPLETEMIEEVRESWIEIRKLPGLSLVTVIELLSPSNKVGLGREEYLAKRLEWIHRPVHLVEIDFLLAGQRLPMRAPLPAGNAYALVSRIERRPDSDVYAWSLRDRLPTIAIPLLAPDEDIELDLDPPFAMAYQRGRYARLLRYQEPLSLPLEGEIVNWVAERVREGSGQGA